MNGSMGSLIGNANLIKKVYFPREVFVVSAIGSLLVSFLIELGVLCGILLLLGNMVLPWIPVVLVIVVIQSFFVLGIGFLLSVLNVYFRDVQHLISIALMALFYSAPIVYPITVVPDQAHIGGVTIPLGTIYRLNPLVTLVQSLPRRHVQPALPARDLDPVPHPVVRRADGHRARRLPEARPPPGRRGVTRGRRDLGRRTSRRRSGSTTSATSA